jgi:Zn-finger nucleic acid-binding protein
MLALVACTACRRQFDAGGRAPGTTFACVCGASVTVGAPRGHDAAVVRCSSCGASRQEGETACQWCDSEFTIHEKDLHTICPQCFARISDRARHCHHCGVAIAPQPIGASDPARACPTCRGAPPLRHRSLGGPPPLLECERCAGLWLAPAELRTLVTRVNAGAAQAREILGPLKGKTAAGLMPDSSSGPLYRACVVCTQRMNRTRFAGRAGVIVDYCKDHGVWFDAHELARALEAVAAGSAALDARGREFLPGDAARERKERRQAMEAAWLAEGPLPRSRWREGSAASLGVDLVGAILRLFS